MSLRQIEQTRSPPAEDDGVIDGLATDGASDTDVVRRFDVRLQVGVGRPFDRLDPRDGDRSDRQDIA